ncbi:hypothetical protein TWF696_005019 [Orbilia brochopaga]|uniref:Uncharacterized protein n=1 Tax=Orbilia brochopaga TaxID=3140254 RepID=A0AAV9UZS1_9PEZI
MMAAHEDELADTALFTTRTVEDFTFDQFLNITPGPRLLRQVPAVDFAFATPAIRGLQWGGNEENESPPVFRRWMLQATPGTLDPRILDLDGDEEQSVAGNDDTIDTPKATPKARPKPFSQRLNEQSPKRRCSTPLTTRHIVRQIVHGIMREVAATEASCPTPDAVYATSTSIKPPSTTDNPPPEPVLSEEDESILDLANLENIPDTVPELRILLLRTQEKLKGEILARTRAEEVVRYLAVENQFYRSEYERQQEIISTPAAAPTTTARPGSSAAKRQDVATTSSRTAPPSSASASASSSTTRARRGEPTGTAKPSSTSSSSTAARRPASVAATAPTNNFASSTTSSSRARRDPVGSSSQTPLATRPSRPQSVMATVRTAPKMANASTISSSAHREVGGGGSTQKPYASIFSSWDPSNLAQTPSHAVATSNSNTISARREPAASSVTTQTHRHAPATSSLSSSTHALREHHPQSGSRSGAVAPTTSTGTGHWDPALRAAQRPGYAAATSTIRPVSHARHGSGDGPRGGVSNGNAASLSRPESSLRARR